MELWEIIKDALVYPISNVVSLAIYIVLGIVLGIALTGTILAISAGIAAENLLAVLGIGVIGGIVVLLIGFIITGYELDIIKYGIERSDESPKLDFVRQFINGVKYFVVNIVYMIIPIIVGAILAIFLQHWFASVIDAIISIVFSLALVMGVCRLAKTEDLGYALSIGDAITDISKVGIVTIILFIIIMFIIVLVLSFIGAAISQWNSIIGGILVGILGVYITFFAARAIGLLYSDV
ncbi:DUF4013 domain-containing protein [uncultured Methanobrevibacter sp.]|uniref:DUF4013 domain-containing protein n=1 Tax=uncultured Methanobrevibacter sp. TaxID=253161 RepID=UPI0026176BAA|nr:DUF4013 domain-containing protein [uncultured Methanobrevibacter sp.]